MDADDNLRRLTTSEFERRFFNGAEVTTVEIAMLNEMRAEAEAVIRANGLRGEGYGPHAEETEQPEHAIEDDGGDGDAAKEIGLAKTAYGRGCDDAEKRRRQIG